MSAKQAHLKARIGVWLLLAAVGGGLASVSVGQTTSDVVVTYTYDQHGNRTFEQAKSATATEPSAPTVLLSASSDSESASTLTGPAWAFSHISASASGGTPPYTFHWSATSTGTCTNAGSFWVPADFWANQGSVDSMFETSAALGATISYCGKWQLVVYDALGTLGSPPLTLTIRHNYAPT
jgi:hypothetical protein